MSKTNAYENDLLKLIFQGTAKASLWDNYKTSPVGNLFVALHTADPGETATTQVGSECAYTGYARQAVVRTAVGWTVTGNSVSPAAAINFPQCTAGPETVTHFSVGDTGTSHSYVLYSGTVTPNISVAAGVTPQLASTSTITED